MRFAELLQEAHPNKVAKLKAVLSQSFIADPKNYETVLNWIGDAMSLEDIDRLGMKLSGETPMDNDEVEFQLKLIVKALKSSNARIDTSGRHLAVKGELPDTFFYTTSPNKPPVQNAAQKNFYLIWYEKGFWRTGYSWFTGFDKKKFKTPEEVVSDIPKMIKTYEKRSATAKKQFDKAMADFDQENYGTKK